MPREHAMDIEYRGCQIAIIQDEDAESPDDWDSEDSFLVHFHRSFHIAKADILSENDLCDIYQNAKTEKTKELKHDYWIFPVSAYIHSGVSLSLCDSFACDTGGWDTSHVGAIFIRKKAEKKWRLSKNARQYAEGLLESWNNYLSGEVYLFKIACEKDDSIFESCGGFNGSLHGQKNGEDPYIVQEAKSSVDCMLDRKRKEHIKYLKEMIRNRVGLQYREASGF